MKVKDKIICLVGESGSGKTTIAKELEKQGYNIIHSYTTRPPREKDEWGHIFVWDIAYRCTPKEEIIAYTYYDDHHYWAIKDQYQGKGNSIYVVDVAGVDYLRQNVKDAEVIVVYLKCDERQRCERMLDRLTEEQFYNLSPEEFYRQINERVEKDKEYFAVVKCDYCIDANGTIGQTLDLIKQVIK